MPGVPHALAPDARVRVGTALLIVTPAGDELGTTISGIEMIDRGRPLSHAPFSVPPAITKKQLPIGSKVYALQDPAA
ncbi:hypothetical protein [Achromobacter sp. RTa]|uniref:hypothetical protein n=1 Tax=Achromobacter sp. RTa TaxID=1532557 RepID=UPI0012E010E3|nr:hypothetical protein [Achromobacter sp. RTa]